jgi:hypothetical protein
VKLFNILQLFETWVTTTAAVVSLRPLSFGLLLATFADSSVRVVSAPCLQPSASAPPLPPSNCPGPALSFHMYRCTHAQLASMAPTLSCNNMAGAYHASGQPRAPPATLAPDTCCVPVAVAPLPPAEQLDACSAYGYSHSVVATPPQLSTSDLVGAAVGLTAGRLYALLGNGHVHVWELHLQRPPTFQVRRTTTTTTTSSSNSSSSCPGPLLLQTKK